MTPTLDARVERCRSLAADVRGIELRPVGESPLPLASPGSHIDVHLPGGLVRQYSLCNGPGDKDSYKIAVKRDPSSRGGSQAMHELREGDLIRIGVPRNNFPLDAGDGPCLLVAGGIGVTPLLSMARHLHKSGRRFELMYFTRGISDTAFHDELSAETFKSKVTFHYALAPEAVAAYLRRKLRIRPPGGQLYLCGPRPFMDLVEQTASVAWPAESVHLEYFSADPSALAGPKGAFVVKLARAGIEVQVGPEQSIVQALSKAGVQVDMSCEQGVCGTCLTGVIAGIPDHRDVYLTDEEKRAGDKICPCVSRSLTPSLVLDL